MTPPPAFDTVHAPLAWWAARTPDAVALDDGVRRWSFAALAQAVAQRAQALDAAPAIAWMDEGPLPSDALASFLAILAAGRAAAVGDPDWPPALRAQVVQGLAAHDAGVAPGAAGVPGGPFYVGFTSGSTGVPKGFIRSHRSWTTSFEAALQAFGDGAATTLLAPGRLSHSLFLFGALLGLWTGAGVRLQPRFSADAALHTLARGDARSLVAVPSQLLLMLEHARRHGPAVLSSTRLVMVSGAPWPRSQTPALRALFPQARIVEFYGASETSFIAWTDSDPALPPSVVGRPFDGVDLRVVRAAADGPAPGLPPAAPGEPGLIYVRSGMLFDRYVVAADAPAPPLLRDGDALSVRDIGHLDAEGRLHLRGRQQRMFGVGGRNLFPEEVEAVLAAHPAVAQASVLAWPDPLRGQRPVAVLQLARPVGRRELVQWCRARLEPYKTPARCWTAAGDWPRTLSGKTDHAALQAALAGAREHGHGAPPPGWTPLPWRAAPATGD